MRHPGPVPPIPLQGLAFDGEIVQVTVDVESALEAPSAPLAEGEQAPLALQGPPPPAPGSLRVALRLDPEIPRRSVEFTLRCASRDPRLAYGHGLFDRDGSLVYDSLVPGPARLEVWPVTARSPEARRFLALDVTIAAEGPTPLELDLRAKLFRHRIALEGLDPRYPFTARVHFDVTGYAGLPRFYHRVWQPPIEFVSPHPRIDAVLFAPGYRTVRLRGLGELETVRLEPGIPVRLRLHAPGGLPAPPRYLKASLVPAWQPEIGFDWQGPAFDASCQLVTRVGEPGRMRVAWIAAEHEEEGQGGGTVIELDEPTFVDVLDSSKEQVFDLELSAEELARLGGIPEASPR